MHIDQIFSMHPPMIGNMPNGKSYTVDFFYGWIEVDKNITVDDLYLKWINISEQYTKENLFTMVIDKVKMDDELHVIIRKSDKYKCTCGSTNEMPCKHINMFVLLSQEIINKRIQKEKDRNNTSYYKPTNTGENILVKSFSEDRYYNVNIYDGTYSCQCKGFYRANLCAHIEKVKVDKGIIQYDDTIYLKKKRIVKKQPKQAEIDKETLIDNFL